MKTMGVQGARGSFSEVAALTFCQRQKIQADIEYLISAEPVLHAVENGTIDVGIFAIENARGGVVIESVKALALHRCHIIEMFHVPISQNLLALPGMAPGKITAIHSHQQALRQCRDYLADHFWSCPLVEEDDTAEAARRLSVGELPTTAAVIGNQACAELYGLEILTRNIHDLKNNLTLFLAVKALRT